MSQQPAAKTSRVIAIEEHFATPDFMAGPGHGLSGSAGAALRMPDLPERLCDLGDGRIAAMDAAGIDMQVLSLTAPGVEQLEPAESVAQARRSNDILAEASHRHPDRLAGFAALPTPDPAAASAELSRAVGELGLKGGVINGHSRGRYLDDPFFWPIFERAETLNVPIYLHPTMPPQPVMAASYTGNFAPEVGYLLAGAGWGWHIETAIHVIRIILSGVFDRYPGLQIVIGHLGEGLPFMQERLDGRMNLRLTKLARPFVDYLRGNVHYTISGFNWTPQFMLLLGEVGIERILFSADYPYAPMAEARAFLDQLPISPADKEQIGHGNLEKLLRL